MNEWYCNIDKVQMIHTEITLRYMEMKQSVPGLKCPKCGTAYLTEDIVMTVVKAAEEALEGK